MTEITDSIEKYGFNSPLVNFQNHKSFKRSQNVSVGEAYQIFEEICYYLEKKSPKKKMESGPSHGPFPKSGGSTEPPKPDPKYTTEEVGIPINQIPTIITLSSSPNPSTLNQSVTITAKIVSNCDRNYNIYC